jgi:hypothetical protein
MVAPVAEGGEMCVIFLGNKANLAVLKLGVTAQANGSSGAFTELYNTHVTSGFPQTAQMWETRLILVASRPQKAPKSRIFIAFPPIELAF